MVFGNQNGGQERSTPPIEVTAEATPALPLLNVKGLVPSRCCEASLAQSLIAPPRKNRAIGFISSERFAIPVTGEQCCIPHQRRWSLVKRQLLVGAGAAQG